VISYLIYSGIINILLEKKLLRSKYLKVIMHRLSFNFKDHYIKYKEFTLAFRVYTLYNIYGPCFTLPKVEDEENKVIVEAKEYFWAGGQKKRDGWFKAILRKIPRGFEIEIEAEHEEPIKGVGILLKGLEGGKILDSDWSFIEPKDLINYAYPWPWLSESKYLPAPLYFIKHKDGSYTYALSLDSEIRPKRFRVLKENSELTLYLIHDEDMRKIGKRIKVPLWRIGRTKKPEEVIETRMRIMEEEWGLKSWDKRDDVPEWARDICLVLNIHFKHWTGYIFNTYKRALEVMEWISKRIPGKHVLALLAGWDGRYYYDYPSLEPDPDLGGNKDFKDLVNGAHELGIHVIPMTCPIAVGFTHAKRLDFEEAIVIDKYGNKLYENWVDWDEDGERDNIWYPINVGHPRVKKYLFERIRALVYEYDIDGIFFDINFFYENDPRYNIYEGIKSLIEELHSTYPKRLLIMGECWYDALLPFIPLTHTHGLLPKNWSYFYLKYARIAYHLSWPAPNGSTGVHEKGYDKFRVPRADYDIIPTLTVVNGIIPDYAQEVEEVINIAIEWSRHRSIKL